MNLHNRLTLMLLFIEFTFNNQKEKTESNEINQCSKELFKNRNDADSPHHSFKSSIETNNSSKFKQNVDPFIDFLENNFKPEIKLEEPQSLFEKNESQPKSQQNIVGKKKYKGNRLSTTKGVHSERRDILHKNLIRSIRRYLWSQFKSLYNISLFGKRKHSSLYEISVKSFFQNFLKSKTSIGSNISEEDNEKVCFLFSIVMSTDFYYVKMSSQQMKFASLFKTILKAYSVKNYQKFITMKEVKIFMTMLDEKIKFP